MKVTSIIVNDGNLPREDGFANTHLDTSLGLINKGPGQRFGFAFQIAFGLEGISGKDVKLTRHVTYKNDYPRPSRTAQQILEDFGRKPLRNSDPSSVGDSPNEKNIKREVNRVVVQDHPGPSLFVNDPKMYPLRFEGKFILTLNHPTSELLLARVVYYVYVMKPTLAGQVEGGFELMEKTIVPGPSAPSPPL